MATQEYGPRRSRVTRKPQVQCPEVVFYRCGVCGRILQQVGCADRVPELFCCGEKMEVLKPVPAKEMGEELALTYQIVGGYNDNAVRVSWKVKEPLVLEWLYLKTYTGGYMKYLIPGKKPPMVFALADEDAFAYCDESPCLECVFWCKRGFVIYGYVQGMGLVELPIDKANAYWQSGTEHKQTAE